MAILHQLENIVRPAALPADDWRREMREAIRDPLQLCQALGLDSAWAAQAAKAAAAFPLFAPRPLVRRMRAGDPHDPLLRQVLPLDQELVPRAGFEDDPLREASANLAPGLLQKYQGRALLVATGACSVHCRYCFRRHYPYPDENPRADRWRAALRAIAEDESLEELILSGGDPLTLDDSVLMELLQRLEEIPSLRRLRIHTRLPIMIPSRVTNELLGALSGRRLKTWMVIHCNHPRELDDEVATAIERIRAAGVPLLNQAVWLRGVNDSAETQIALSRRLLDLQVIPYYLHLLDRVSGAAHFEAPLAAARDAIRAMRACLPGYGVPRLARETPQASGKHIVM